MLNLKLNAEHDLDLVNGNVPTTSDLVQRIDCRIRTFLGEHWLNPEIGVPYFTDFLVKNPDTVKCAQIIAAQIRTVPGVSSVERVKVLFDKTALRLSISFVVKEGDVVLDGVSTVL